MIAELAAPAISGPTIYVTEADYERLSALAGSAAEHLVGVALLRAELERAVFVRADEFPAAFVKLGSTVRFEDRSTRRRRTIQLVLPESADIDANRISVLTPVGAALLGLTAGREFTWKAADGRVRTLSILEVTDPSEQV